MKTGDLIGLNDTRKMLTTFLSSYKTQNPARLVRDITVPYHKHSLHEVA